MEFEFIAADKPAEEIEWLRSFLEDVPMWEKHVSAIHIHYDSQSSIARDQNNLNNGKSRHIKDNIKLLENLSQMV